MSILAMRTQRSGYSPGKGASVFCRRLKYRDFWPSRSHARMHMSLCYNTNYVSERDSSWCCYLIAHTSSRYITIAPDAESRGAKRSRNVPRVQRRIKFACNRILPHAITLSQAAGLDSEAKPSLTI